MTTLVIFPWIDRKEVRSLNEELFSKDVRKQKHALDRISVWKCRSMNRLPSAVESTFSLISAQIARKENDICEFGMDTQLRNLFSMAIIRFVNHITEKGQQGAFAKPVHIVAYMMGVPEWIVELRHEATHGSLPSLNELEAATSWALEWLRENFWEPQALETFHTSSLTSATGDKLKDALVNYMQGRFKDISDGDISTNKQQLTDIKHMLQKLGSHACPILLEDGYLILTEEQLNYIGYSYADLRSNGSLLLPPKIIEIWKKVFHILVKTNLFADLLLHMASLVTETSSLRNFLLCCWLYSLIWCNQTKLKKTHSNLFQTPVEIPYTSLLEKCLRLRNKDADSLLNLIIDNANLTRVQAQNLRQLLSVSKSSDKSDKCNGVKVLHIDDLNEKKTWRKCLEPVDWSKLPIGLLPNQTLDYACLELGSYQASLSFDQSRLSDDDYNMEEQSVDTIDIDYATNRLSNDGELLANMTNTNVFQWDEEEKQKISDNIQLL